MERNPPEPTDLHNVDEYSVDRCRSCLEIVEDQSDHYDKTECNNQDLTEVSVNGGFGVVVPETSGYLWRKKTGGFAIRKVKIQGTYIPIGSVWSYNLSEGSLELPINLSNLNLGDFDNPKELRRFIKEGFRRSTEYEYGGKDLGRKLVEERLDGVYEKNEEAKEQRFETRDERIQSVWTEIDDALPFTYNRVPAPKGYPRTREGLRWIEVTGHNVSDEIESEFQSTLFQKPWVEALVDEDAVALYYPNCD